MQTDSRFYQLFARYPASRLDLLNILADTDQFDSVEVQQTACRIDGVFLAPPQTSPTPSSSAKSRCSPTQTSTVLERSRQEVSDPQRQKEIIDLIETIVFYTFPKELRSRLETLEKIATLPR